MDHGADVTATAGENNATALYGGYHNLPSTEKMEFLLKHGLDPNAADSRGNTPIMRSRLIEQIELLSQYGANINAQNHDGKTVLHMVFQSYISNLHPIVKCLINLGADVNIRDNECITPLFSYLEKITHNWSMETYDLMVDNRAEIGVDIVGNLPKYSFTLQSRDLLERGIKFRGVNQKLVDVLMRDDIDAFEKGNFAGLEISQHMFLTRSKNSIFSVDGRLWYPP